MTATIAPSIEACEEITAKINATLETADNAYPAKFRFVNEEALEDISTKARIDVVHVSETDQEDTLDVMNRTAHVVHVVVRRKVQNQDERAAAALLFQKIRERLNNFDSDDLRVRVMRCRAINDSSGSADMIRMSGLFVAKLELRIEVMP